MDKLDIHVEQVEEILSSPPKWIYRWGITTISCSLILIIILANEIKYPKILHGKVTVKIENSSLNSKYNVTVTLAETKSGVSIGQHVNLRLNGVNLEEADFIPGLVKEFVYDTDNSLQVKVQLENGLVSKYGRLIHVKNEMYGSADIITSKKSLFDRLLNR
ncbi:MAG: hypothetical protein ACJ76F_12355 [Bacteroidia bacterium]